jgi:serine phosphatase RsbU (regulator of sigma subunit)
MSDARLRGVLSVTDAALSRLGPEELFQELLERLRAIVEADTAAIMLLEEETEELVTVAAIGLEDEVRQGFRLEVGRGFAGRIAQTRQPLIVDSVDAESVASPILRQTGITTLIGVPMHSGGDLVGVLHVGTFKPRRFTEQDLALLQLVADRAATAHQARQAQADRAATLALQRSLLPTRLPSLVGVDLAARYLPGHESGVGGDWYDVFGLPSGDLGIVVGDVSGHGLRAAVVMGRLRSALRAYALIEEDPATVLTFLDRKITHFEAGNLATILYAKINPSRSTIRMSVAGHMPPLLACPGKPARIFWTPPDLPVGVGDARPRRTTSLTVTPGTAIVFFTDGLVERRGEVLDAGLGRLCATVSAGSAEEVCAGIVGGMDVAGAEDDIAVLAVRFRR